jgi:hypothetical protein
MNAPTRDVYNLTWGPEWVNGKQQTAHKTRAYTEHLIEQNYTYT